MIDQKIKMLREKRGITQAELAKRLGITRSGVNAWEMGISTPSTQYVILLAKFFNVSTDYLLGLSPTPYGSLLAVNAEALPPDAKRELDSFVGYLTEKYCKGGQ